MRYNQRKVGFTGGFIMKTLRRFNLPAALLLTVMMLLSFAGAVFASDDNSLSDLGITTQGTTVSPDFRYDIWEYSVQVPAGTTELELTPRTTNPSATINSVSGTTLNADGTGTVIITVTSESGNAIDYVLNVTSARGPVDPAEAIAANESSSAVTIDTEVVQSEVETEDPRYVKVDRNSLKDAENTIEKLQAEITAQREHIRLLTYVLYGLIAVSIIFLFVLISLLLRRRDLSHELREYRENDPYRTKHGPVSAPVGEDGWGDWGDEEEAPSAGKTKKAKKKKKSVEDDDGWGDEPANAQTSWTQTHIGTPVQPQRRPSQHSDETKMYRTAQPSRNQNVPKDVTKDLSRVNKAEAKAMKKAAAAQAKAEEDARRAAAARAAEARRQAEQARKIEEQNRAAREAQERALEKAAQEKAAAAKAAEEKAAAKAAGAKPAVEEKAPDTKSSGKGVEIDMIDL